MGKHFVLIHGAWHGGWAWEGVIRSLTEAGHTAEAPTLPGHSPDDDRSRITFESYVQKITEVLWRQTNPVVLVGHSSAGFLLQSAAPMVRRKIERLGAAPNIPPRSNRRWKNCFSPALCRERNAIECMVARLKDFRRIATRYDRLAQIFLAAICLEATVCYWL